MLLFWSCRLPTQTILYVNDGSSPCDESSWRQLPAPAKGPGSGQTFDSTPAFVYAHQFSGSDQVITSFAGCSRVPSWLMQGPSLIPDLNLAACFLCLVVLLLALQMLLVYFGDRWQPSVPQGPSNASYVWLPLVAAGDVRQPDALQLLNLNSWRLGDFRPPAALAQS